MPEKIAVGIDLGTTNTCVGYLWNGKIEILENQEGDRITPSVVFFLDNNRTIVGKYARKMSDTKRTGGVSEVKRLIGRQYNDPHIQNNLENFSYSLARFDGDLFKIVVDTITGTITKTPQEICSLILEKIKKDIDTKFGRDITKAVITVPAYFNVSQREATLEAAKLAGFDVLKLLNEPTAAALSYFYKNINENNRNCTSYALVYDLGGGTFDVAILKRSNNQIDIICVDGDSYLGGYDLDQLLINYVCKILKERYNYNPRDKYEDMRRILNECEDAKKTLSTMEEAEIILTGLINEPIIIKLTRQDFEAQAEQLFRRTIIIVDRCLKTSKLNKNQINKIILAGGSTRIPKIQQLIALYFNRDHLDQFVHPDECVAEGAALQAALLSSHHQQKIDKFIINDVISLSLGVGEFCGFMGVIIAGNSKIPTSCSKGYRTIYDKQTSIAFDIYEGERFDVNKNYKLATLEIDGLTPAPPGQCSVILTLSVDQNGILTATAKEKLSGKTKDLKIVYTRRERNDKEIQSIVVNAREKQQEDKIFKKMVKIKRYLIKYCIAIKFNLDDKNLTEQYRTIYDRCDEILDIAELLQVGDEGRIRELTEEVENLCRNLLEIHPFQL